MNKNTQCVVSLMDEHHRKTDSSSEQEMSRCVLR